MTVNREPARLSFVPGDPDTSFQADDGLTAPAKFLVYPADPAPQGDRMIAAVLVWVALVLAVVAIGYAVSK